MDVLENSVQPYAWGSHSAIAELLGRPTPSAGPEAELWLGAHPVAPSCVVRDGVRIALDQLIESRPEQELGNRVLGRYGPRLPFLLKVLAAEQPLSLQAHPSLEQAKAGFDAEEARGVPRDAPERCYRDRNHKPELLCALTPFHALCGFREPALTLELFDALDLKELQAALGRPDGLRHTFSQLMSLALAERERLVSQTLAGCARLSQRERFGAEARWALRLGELYPGDVGIVCALLLNLVTLAPGEAIYLPAGNLHAYLGGVGVEVMANSDNVLRGGLTPKHVDVGELVRVLEFAPHRVEHLLPRPADGERIYDTPASEFRLSRIELGEGDSFEAEVEGPEILLCLEGRISAKTRAGASVELERGGSAFVSAADESYSLGGAGVAYRARVGSG